MSPRQFCSILYGVGFVMMVIALFADAVSWAIVGVGWMTVAAYRRHDA